MKLATEAQARQFVVGGSGAASTGIGKGVGRGLGGRSQIGQSSGRGQAVQSNASRGQARVYHLTR